MAETWLVLGGARSGKTRRGLALAGRSATPVYVATAQARDDEMRERIAHHRDERGAAWHTIEAPLDICGAIAQAGNAQGAVLVDCLTLWLANLMEAGLPVEAQTEKLVQAMPQWEGTVIFISNEVGLGIVPQNALGRQFRDAQGRLNQAIAAAADHVEFVAAGLPLILK